MSENIRIFDTTLRDGEQAPGFSMTIDQKLQLAKQLERLRVNVIEAGFPIASDGDFESVKQVAKAIESVTICGLARTKKLDLDRAWEALQYAKKPCIHTFIATSDIHIEHKLQMTRDQVLKQVNEMVRYACSLTPDIEFSAEDAIRTDIDFLIEVFSVAVEAGAKTLNIPDTVGYSIPSEIARIVHAVNTGVRNVDQAVLSIHCHNDLGLGVANSIAAIEQGVRQVECTINGIGERAGNAALEELVMAIRTRNDLLNFSTQINTQEIYPTSRMLSNLTGMKVQRNKAIVGENAFAHEAGIHQHGMMQNKQTYEIMTPESVGIHESQLVLGKHSGRHALERRYQELGYDLSKETLEIAYKAFTRLADKKKSVYDADLIAIIRDEVHEIPEAFLLEGIQVLSGSHVTPTATVRLKSRETIIIEDSSVGDGPVDAACKAIERLTGINGKLVHYSINAVTIGKDAMGEVLIKIEHENQHYNGQAVSTDVIEASAKAYLMAINRIVYTKENRGTQTEIVEDSL